MDRQIEQNISVAKPLNQEGKKTKHYAAEPSHQNSLMEPSFYKYQNNVLNNIPMAPTFTHCWSDTSVMGMESQSEQRTGTQLVDYRSTDNHNRMSQESQLKTVKSFSRKSAKVKEPRQIEHSLKERSRSSQRSKHPERWKVNMKKTARLKGEEYIGVGGKLVPAKVMGPPCACRSRCSDKIDEKEREELHNVFWKTCTWEQRKQYIALSVKESPKQRTRCRGNVKSEHRRQITFTYSLLIRGEFITVCKNMFLSTFSVSEKFVRHAMDKKRTSPGGIIGPDQRGRHAPKTKKAESVKERIRHHIMSFPTESGKDLNGKRYLDSRLNIAAMHKLYILKCRDDGVPESDIVKESYYRELFKTEFNLGFQNIQKRV